jgi:hypothetical protein
MALLERDRTTEQKSLRLKSENPPAASSKKDQELEMSCLSYNLISDRFYIPSSQPQLRRCPSPSLWHINSCTQHPIMNLHLYVAQRFLDRANLHSTLYHYAPLSHMLNLPHFTDQCFRSSYLRRVQEKVHSTHADYSPRLCQDPCFLPSSFCQD